MSTSVRLARRVLSSSRPLRAPSARTSARTVFSQRSMSSSTGGAHGSSGGSDTPWMVGSGLLFGPALLYLLSPSARKSSHGDAHDHSSHAHSEDATHATVEETEQTEDSPKDAEPAVESQPAEDNSMTDDEGTKASGEEIQESVQNALNTDSPKDAQVAEEATSSDSEPAPAASSDSAAEGEGEKNEPTDIGQARAEAVTDTPPKKADPEAEQ
ncbi:hypothetical protein SERLA73DRAFT_183485 [Serpula lacrymans var. lacrymans S7.3]|uniref:Uncharacterized protein n=2 Tax=Serpula lacrymans var. lacrymans TaxID=341189 RepID=F8PZZ1_SERL3|nr:uncharacterized protein SERLADRAFT_470687 [Serpula lacrymans var. lacrymans S7.9]EGN98463.1 hypothetical protein SERLA73DRAFT_183485 [Serpula lacrymans var. lacrymans S7.3]EGO24042.1 hypothetical protein SERLADRAFT_470687 [Serpula lacrymans var. lacrymans S7.9]